MNTELEEWQARLSLHFATLRDSRRARGTTEPLFGLEHGLSRTEVQDLERAVRTHIAYRPPSRDHWLAWVVYSAELGYRYSGDEYWQTFDPTVIEGGREARLDAYRELRQYLIRRVLERFPLTPGPSV